MHLDTSVSELYDFKFEKNRNLSKIPRLIQRLGPLDKNLIDIKLPEITNFIAKNRQKPENKPDLIAFIHYNL